jgi:Big-like domain-containing protein/uncharacterized protein DUF11
MKVFDKQGNLGPLDVDLSTFFGAFLSLGQFASDPHVRYDRLSGRWFVTAITATGGTSNPPNNIMIAVSSGPTITSSSSFTFFTFRHDQVGQPQPNVDSGGFADYDTLGVDKNALYVGVNVFKIGAIISTIRSTGYVINKANLLSGVLTVTPFRELGTFTVNSRTGTSSGSGMDTPQGVDNDDPNATEGYFIGVDMTSFSILNLRRVSNPGGTPSISPNIVLPVPTTAFPLDQVQFSGLTLDAVSDRLFAAAIHTNRITGTKSLWTAHNIAVDAGGIGTDAGDRNGSRWYEIRDLSTTPTVFQAGTVFDSTTSGLGFWIPSVAMSGQGHMALGASFSSVGDLPGVAVAGRLADDPLGTTSLPPALVVFGEAIYDDFLNEPPQRWGDYSQTAVDPADAQTMWTFQEYSNFAGIWTVRATQLKAPRPQITSVSPSTLPTGLASRNVTVTGMGFFDPGPDPGGPGFPNHIVASMSGGATSNTSFNSTTSVTFNISTLCAAGGPRDVTITNPDGQSTTALGLLTIDFLTTTASLFSNRSPGFVGQSVTFVAKVNSASACPNPTGTVTFKEGGTILGTASLVAGQANITTSALSAGMHNITAQYNGDFRYSVSTSAPLSQTILLATSTSLSSSQNPSALGASVTFTANVSNVPSAAQGPTGTVTFTDNGSPIGPPVSVSGGVATRSIAFSTAVSHFIQARYNGDSLHNPSSSPTIHQRVQAPGVGVSIGSNSPDPVTIGNVVTVTTVITNTGGSGTAYTFQQSLAGRFVFISASPSQGSCSGSGPINCNMGTIGAGLSATVTTQLRALFGHDISVTNSAAASGATTATTNNVRVRFRPFHF